MVNTDKVSEYKKKLQEIVKSSKLTKIEKDKQIREKCKELDEDEVYVLKKDFEKQYVTNQCERECMIIRNVGVIGMTLIVSTAKLYYGGGNHIYAEQLKLMYNLILGLVEVILCMGVYSLIKTRYDNSKIKFILDAMEKKL